MIVKLTGIPENGYCWDQNGKICSYFNNEGGYNKCELWDFLNVGYKQEVWKNGTVSNNVCPWVDKVVV